MTGPMSGYDLEFDVRSGEWRAVAELPQRAGEFSPAGRVRVVKRLDLPRGSGRIDAERELRRLDAYGLL